MKSNGYLLTIVIALVSACYGRARSNGAQWYPASVTGPSQLSSAAENTVPLPPIVNQVRVDVKADCGAIGDGATDDTAAFAKAAQILEAKGGGTLVIPPGTYLVGLQTHTDGTVPYYLSQPVFSVKNLNGLLVEGNGAVIRLKGGWHFGSFDPATGESFTPPRGRFTDRRYRAGDVTLFNIGGSSNVVVRNLELDGNVSSMVLGGMWGDVGRQIGANGITLYQVTNAYFSHVVSHYNALDGIEIGWRGLKADSAPNPCTLADCDFEYNGRQGLSWIGGVGLRAYRCKFDHTGRAMNNGSPLASAPGAGLDIEAELSVCRDGRFENCEFVDNVGSAFITDSGDGGYTTFKSCTFWGTTNYSLWSNKPGLKYEDCNIYGRAVHAYGSDDPTLATSWTRCHFEDKPWTDGKVSGAHSLAYLLELNGKLSNVRIEGCDFVANSCRALWINAKPDGRPAMTNCTIAHQFADMPSPTFVSLFRFTDFTGCSFTENFGPENTGHWYIQAQACNVAAMPPTTVQGPHVSWLPGRGLTGIVPSSP